MRRRAPRADVAVRAPKNGVLDHCHKANGHACHRLDGALCSRGAQTSSAAYRTVSSRSTRPLGRRAPAEHLVPVELHSGCNASNFAARSSRLFMLATGIRRRRRLTDDNALAGGRFADRFAGLIGRNWWHRLALGGVERVAAAGILLATVAFLTLTARAPGACITVWSCTLSKPAARHPTGSTGATSATRRSR